MKVVAAALLALSLSTSAWAQNIAVVNGKPVPSARLDAFIALLKRQGQNDSPALRDRLKEELINREVFLQEAERRGTAKLPEVQSELELMRQTVLIRSLFADFIAKNPVSDADVQAEYDKFRQMQGDKEYRARHILVKTEDEAKAIITKLKNGAKFEELAKQSIDTGSAKNGGDLDWSAPSSYVKPFADAMVKLNKGQITETPVNTQFGWHVIQLTDTRPTKFPSLAEIKPQIEDGLRQQRLQKFQAELRAKAKVE